MWSRLKRILTAFGVILFSVSVFSLAGILFSHFELGQLFLEEIFFVSFMLLPSFPAVFWIIILILELMS